MSKIRVAYTKVYADNFDAAFGYKKAKLRYPLRIARRLFPEGTELQVATLKEARRLFPKIEENDASEFLAVWFPGFSHPTIVHRNQLIL